MDGVMKSDDTKKKKMLSTNSRSYLLKFTQEIVLLLNCRGIPYKVYFTEIFNDAQCIIKAIDQFERSLVFWYRGVNTGARCDHDMNEFNISWLFLNSIWVFVYFRYCQYRLWLTVRSNLCRIFHRRLTPIQWYRNIWSSRLYFHTLQSSHHYSPDTHSYLMN